jgi:hypothetical protein
MGADLYQKGKAYPDGYFRDSYNDYNVLWQMDLSWWRDITPMLNNHHELTVKGIKEFKAMVEAREIPAEPKAHDGKPITCATRDDYVKRRQELLDYLNQAIKEKIPIKCSL